MNQLGYTTIFLSQTLYIRSVFPDIINEEDFMRLAIAEAKIAFKDGEKTPFGAVIVKNNQVISKAHNTAKKSSDPTAHAEINAIRIASAKLQSHHLEGCTLYSTCEPCPMCFTSAWWAKIQRVVYGINLSDITQKGQREIEVDSAFLNEKSGSKIDMKSGFLREECLKLFEK